MLAVVVAAATAPGVVEQGNHAPPPFENFAFNFTTEVTLYRALRIRCRSTWTRTHTIVASCMLASAPSTTPTVAVADAIAFPAAVPAAALAVSN